MIIEEFISLWIKKTHEHILKYASIIEYTFLQKSSKEGRGQKYLNLKYYL
jgi:hypothetical protein